MKYGYIKQLSTGQYMAGIKYEHQDPYPVSDYRQADYICVGSIYEGIPLSYYLYDVMSDYIDEYADPAYGVEDFILIEADIILK